MGYNCLQLHLRRSAWFSNRLSFFLSSLTKPRVRSLICACSNQPDPRVVKMDVHRLKFLDLKPETITSLAFNSFKEFPYLAVGRSDASIEIWRHTEGKRDFCYFMTFPGRSECAVDCLKWSENRLFSTGLTGMGIKPLVYMRIIIF